MNSARGVGKKKKKKGKNTDTKSSLEPLSGFKSYPSWKILPKIEDSKG